MNRKDRRDGLSKSGSGRVGIYRETGLTHIYTLECNYNTGLTLNAIKAAKGKGERLASPPFLHQEVFVLVSSGYRDGPRSFD